MRPASVVCFFIGYVMSATRIGSKSPSTPKPSAGKRRALSVWELPKLLQSVHRQRKPTKRLARERPHFRAILAFVHRNRFAVATQIQRRFSKYLRSDRTARRHLAEMESLGLLGVVETNHVSPLWPKVYFVTRRGLAALKQTLHNQGQEWRECAVDRRRVEGASAQHVLHELFITEFLTMAWEVTQVRDDVTLLTVQRRSLAKHDAFRVVVAGRRTRLQPDAMFLYRQQEKGMMCCFVEIDMGSMSIKQMAAKLRRYQVWAESSEAAKYLKEAYQHYGATAPTAAFRLLVIVGGRNENSENRRLLRLIAIASKTPRSIRDRIWLSTVAQSHDVVETYNALSEPIWLRLRDLSATILESPTAIPKISRHAIFGLER
ncbi:MAG: Replication-relaxation [Schlesneria sp.]|nr:Replication-relaxation [Schlesneria sp.]